MDLPTPTILAEIRQNGPISFARFMELALYEPGVGYYERAPNPIGRHGDFYTSVSVGPLFGELLAAQFAAWLAEDEAAGRIESGQGRSLQIVEAGAHDGRLARDILTWLRAERPETFSRMEYWILDPSTIRRNWQERTLAEFSNRVHRVASWPALGAVRGILFSNELLDAMPAQRLVWSQSRQSWEEAVVTERDGILSWGTAELQQLPPGAEHLSRLPRALLELVPDGFATEVSSHAISWWHEAARALQSGRLVTFDYGLEAEEFLDPGRGHGTLRAYRDHNLLNDPLVDPGQQDLTTHVNFTAIRMAGEHAGLHTELMDSQSSFLTRVATRIWPSSNESLWTAARVRQFQTLTHPQYLGRSFRTLVQRRSAG